MSESSYEFSDDVMQAFLAESTEKNQSDEFFKKVQADVEQQFSTVLIEHGYAPLDESPERYVATHQSVEEELLAYVRDKNGPLPKSENFAQELAATIKRWADLRLVEQDNVEKYLIQYAVGYGKLIEIAAQLDQVAEVAELSAQASDGKRTVFANMIIRRHIPATNPALRAMVAFLPGGDVSINDEAMVPYLADSIAGLPESDEQTARLSSVNRRAFALIGFNPDDRDPSLGIDKREHEVGLLIQTGYMTAYKTSSQREAHLYEYARENCVVLTPQNVHDIIGLIDQEYPASQ